MSKLISIENIFSVTKAPKYTHFSVESKPRQQPPDINPSLQSSSDSVSFNGMFYWFALLLKVFPKTLFSLLILAKVRNKTSHSAKNKKSIFIVK